MKELMSTIRLSARDEEKELKSIFSRLVKAKPRENLKKRGSIVKKASCHLKTSTKHQDCLLKVLQLQNQGSTLAEPSQEWQKAGVRVSHAQRGKAFGG